jgi:DNA-binding CsgD family transcriptional regulator
VLPRAVAAAYEADAVRVREALGEAAFAAAWAAGWALPLEDAIAEALALTTEPTATAVFAAETPDAIASLGLSPRELEVLRLVAAGKTDRESAAALFVSRRTVTSHLTRILTKFEVDSRTAAATHAARQGLA